MQFYKKKEESNLNNEYIKMIEEIKSDPINCVCFECGANEPEYISINNGIFLCHECVLGHLQFTQEISQIIINDLFSLNNNEVKKLYLGGNKKLIEFINFDFSRLKQFPPNILYKTRAVDYYRKRLEFLVKGGKKPIKPIFESAYQLINLPNDNSFGNRKDLFLSPRLNSNDKVFSTQLTPILEGNQLEDENENNLSSYSEKKEEEEDGKIVEEAKKKLLSPQDSNFKNESTFIYSPQKPRTLNGNNSAFISGNNSLLNKSLQTESSKINNKITSKYVNIKKNTSNYDKNMNINQENYKNNTNNINDITDEIKDKNFNEINIGDNNNININSNEKNNINTINLTSENLGDDNTIRIIDGYMNFSKENDSSDFIKNNKGINDSSQLNNKEKDEDEYKIESELNSKIDNDQSNRLINISNIENFSEQSNKKIIQTNKNVKQDKIKEKKKEREKNKEKQYEKDKEKKIKMGKEKSNEIIKDKIKLKDKDQEKFKEKDKEKQKMIKNKSNKRILIDKLEEVDSENKKSNKNNKAYIIKYKKKKEEEKDKSTDEDEDINDDIIIANKKKMKIYKNKMVSQNENNLKNKNLSKNNNNKIINKNNNKNTKIKNTNKNKINEAKKTNKIIKKEKIEEEEEEEGEEEEEEEEKRYFTKNIKETKLIYPKDSKQSTKKINLSQDKFVKKPKKENSNNSKILKAKVTTKKISKIDDYDEDEYEDDYEDYYSKKTKTKSKTILNKVEQPEKNSKNNKCLKNNFINPFKYLKKSFQKKIEEKFAKDSDEEEEEEEESEEEEEEKKLPKSKSKKIIRVVKVVKTPKKIKKIVEKEVESSDSEEIIEAKNKNYKINNKIYTNTSLKK